MVYNVEDFDFGKMKKEKMRIYCQGIYYRLIFSGFDIETTKIYKNGMYHSYMYHWQLSLNDDDILGRSWEECEYAFNELIKNLNLSKNERMLMLIANTSFEFQFLRKRFDITRMFARERRQPLIFEINNAIEVRDAIKISGMNLSTLAKNFCKTQKLKGDLDYNIERNHKTYMTENEKKYCINDVRILSEYSEYLFDKYIQGGFIPTTKTSIVRNDVKCRIKNQYKISKIYKMIESLVPESVEEYNLIMRYLFKGGLTHCNARYQGIVLKNVKSRDKKSSYPYVMFNKLYPMSPFRDFNIDDFNDKINKDIDNIIFIADFYNLEAITSHTTISYHKSKVTGKKLIDNGRIYYAEKCRLYLTEVDYKSMKNLYKWDNMEVLKCQSAKRGHLPHYLLDVLYKYFVIKETTPKNSEEYIVNKSSLNAMFGMCVTRFCAENWTYIDDKWGFGDASNYDKWRRKQFLSPFWGIYITSYARADLERTIYPKEMRDATVYYDTDSNKHLGNHDEFFDKINAEIEKENKKTCDKLGYDFNILKNIGKYEYEGEYRRFKTLGSKRYIVENDKGEIESTISGMGKGAVEKEAKKRDIDAFELFDDKMEISPENVGKLLTSYCDDEHSDIVAGELMHEFSSVSLFEQTSHLNINDDYAYIIKLIKNKYERGVIF